MEKTSTFWRLATLILILAWNAATPAAGYGLSPRLAIVISEASFDADWKSTQMAAHGLSFELERSGGLFEFASPVPPGRILLNDRQLVPEAGTGTSVVHLPAMESRAYLIIDFPEAPTDEP